MITVIDYGLGNIKSVSRALMKIGVEVRISSEKEDIKSSDGIVLPGVGAYKKAMENLDSLGLIDTIKDYISTGRPYLGICLGLQLLFSDSYEHAGIDGPVKGFNIIDGHVAGFIKGANVQKVPHMGWNQVEFEGLSSMYEEIACDSYFYFDHSFFVIPENEDLRLGKTEYGEYFVSSIEFENIWGVQFHPEKSSRVGLQLLRNFSKKC